MAQMVTLDPSRFTSKVAASSDPRRDRCRARTTAVLPEVSRTTISPLRARTRSHEPAATSPRKTSRPSSWANEAAGMTEKAATRRDARNDMGKAPGRESTDVLRRPMGLDGLNPLSTAPHGSGFYLPGRLADHRLHVVPDRRVALAGGLF